MASQKAAYGPRCHDFDYITNLLFERVDLRIPGNAIYVRAYIENLQKKIQRQSPRAPMAPTEGVGLVKPG